MVEKEVIEAKYKEIINLIDSTDFSIESRCEHRTDCLYYGGYDVVRTKCWKDKIDVSGMDLYYYTLNDNVIKKSHIVSLRVRTIYDYDMADHVTYKKDILARMANKTGYPIDMTSYGTFKNATSKSIWLPVEDDELAAEIFIKRLQDAIDREKEKIKKIDEKIEILVSNMTNIKFKEE